MSNEEKNLTPASEEVETLMTNEESADENGADKKKKKKKKGISMHIPKALEKEKEKMYDEEAEEDEDSDTASETMILALEDYEGVAEPGEIVKGTIISIREDGALVDVGGKSEGIVAKDEFYEGEMEVGKEIEVLVRKEDKNGNIILSRRAALERVGREKMENAFRDKQPVIAKVLGKNKKNNGVEVLVEGMKAFIPASQLTPRRNFNLDNFIGKEIECQIIEFRRDRSRKTMNIVLSHRELLNQKEREAFEAVQGKYQVGDVVTGTVARIANFGAFVDIGGIDALLHITDLSWSHVKNVDEVVKVGDEVSVKILKIDTDDMKISVGVKQKTEDPWENVSQRYTVGSVVECSIKNIVSYGMFLELEEGIEGLLHVSDISWTKKINDPAELFKVGEKVKVKLLALESENKKISFGYKQLTPNPWDMIADTYPAGAVVKGQVKNLVSYGAFIELQDGVEGLLHISDMSWTSKLKHPNEMLEAGEMIDVKVLSTDVESRKISLGLKQVYPNPWDSVEENYKLGEIYEGIVRNIINFGVFVELESGIEGLVHVSDLTWTSKNVDPKKLVSVGDKLKVRVLEISKEDRKISLGLKQVNPDPWSEVEEKYHVDGIYEGKVRNITNFGAFVELEAGVEGLLHISDISWTKQVAKASDFVKPGDTIQVKVLEVNTKDKKISLGIKQLEDDPWANLNQKFSLGDVVEGEVLRIASFGAFVKVAEGIEGLIHISKLSNERVQGVEDVVKIGDKVQVKIIEIQPSDRKLRLTMLLDEEIVEAPVAPVKQQRRPQKNFEDRNYQPKQKAEKGLIYKDVEDNDDDDDENPFGSLKSLLGKS